MASGKEKLQKIDEKIRRLKELKRKIEKRLKKEKKLAYELAKELVFWYFSFQLEFYGKQVDFVKLVIERLEEALCKRAKDKVGCLKRKLEIVLEHSEVRLARDVAKKILEHMEQNLEEKKESLK